MTIKSAAVFIAWQLQIVISAVQSALRGGRLAARKTLAYCDRHGYLHVADVDGLADVIGYTLAVLGFYGHVALLGMAFAQPELAVVFNNQDALLAPSY